MGIKRFTINEFRAAYPDDDACLDKIFKLRYSNLVCPKCENDKPFTRVKNRRAYQCPCCAFQIYPTKDTVFEKTTTPLTAWFYAIYLQTTTRNGVAAKELERQLNICYKTALRMAHQIKILMANKDTAPLVGIVELDETYIGGRAANRHWRERQEMIKKGTGMVNKLPVFGMVERNGRITFKTTKMTDGETLKPIIRDGVHKDAIIITDGFGAYKDLHLEFKGHEIVNHEKGEYVRGDYHTNTIEGMFAQLKRTIRGTHIHVSKEHLQKYVDEVAFRYCNRSKQDEMFEITLSHVV